MSWKPSACRRGTRSGVLLQKLMVHEPFHFLAQFAQSWSMVHGSTCPNFMKLMVHDGLGLLGAVYYKLYTALLLYVLYVL